MSKASDALREALNVVNGHDVAKLARTAGLPDVYLTYHPNEYGRRGRFARWAVVRPGFKTDPTAHWEDRGCKTFTVYERDHKPVQLAEAKAWAGERYGVEAWATIPGLPGYVFPASVVAHVKAALKNHK